MLRGIAGLHRSADAAERRQSPFVPQSLSPCSRTAAMDGTQVDLFDRKQSNAFNGPNTPTTEMP
jgi:hypothetical protein